MQGCAAVAAAGRVILLIWGAVCLFRVGFGNGLRTLDRRIVDHIDLVLACPAYTMFAVSNVVCRG